MALKLSLCFFSSSEGYRSKECANFSSHFTALENRSKLIKVKVMSLSYALLILLMRIENNAGYKLTYDHLFKLVSRSCAPTELLCVLLVQHIPEMILRLVTENVVDTVASVCRQIKE